MSLVGSLAVDRVVLAWVSGGSVDTAFMTSKDGMLRYDRDHHRRIVHSYDMESGPRITANRNRLVAKWISEPDPPEWMLMIDTDMVFEADALDRLIETVKAVGAGIGGGLCFSAGPPPKPTSYTVQQDGTIAQHLDYARDAPSLVDGTGAAFMLISLDVARTLWNLAMKDGQLSTPNPWFAEGIDSQGREYGEDIAFCLRARRAGFTVVVDPRIEIGHRKPMIVDERMFDLYRDFQAEELGVPFSMTSNDFYEQQAVKRGIPWGQKAERVGGFKLVDGRDSAA
jgi:hypothetical protein